MSFVIRTWGCLNKRCNTEFDSGEPNPPCPKCGTVKVCWRPRGGNILSAKTTHNDRTLRAVADRFRLTDMGQHGGTHAGERAAKPLPTPQAIGKYSPAPGFSVPWSDRVTGAWADKPFGKSAKVPTNGPKFKNRGGRIPTQITHRDPSKVVL